MQSNINDSCDNTNLKFYDLWKEYEIFLKAKYKYQTYSKIIERVNTHILPFFKDMYIKNISHLDIVKWMNIINEKKYSYNYCSAIHTALVEVLNYGVEFYNLKDNMAKRVGNFAKVKSKKEMQYWTLDEYESFINVIKDKTYKVFFETLYFTGIRQGEARALTWNDLKNNYIEINKTIAREKYNGEYVINSPKTESSNRIVLIHDNLKKSLHSLLKNEKKKKDFNSNWLISTEYKPITIKVFFLFLIFQ